MDSLEAELCINSSTSRNYKNAGGEFGPFFEPDKSLSYGRGFVIFWKSSKLLTNYKLHKAMWCSFCVIYYSAQK